MSRLRQLFWILLADAGALPAARGGVQGPGGVRVRRVLPSKPQRSRLPVPPPEEERRSGQEAEARFEGRMMFLF